MWRIMQILGDCYPPRPSTSVDNILLICRILNIIQKPNSIIVKCIQEEGGNCTLKPSKLNEDTFKWKHSNGNLWKRHSTERETSGATWYRNFGLVLASKKGIEAKLLRKSPDQSRRRCDGGIRNSTLRFHVILILDMRTWYYCVKQSQLFLLCSRFNHICEQTRFTS